MDRHGRIVVAPLAVFVGLVTACRTSELPRQATRQPVDSTSSVVVRDTVIPGIIAAHGTAAPYQRATLATKLMATVRAVPVHVGDRVPAGQLLVELDVRELAAQRAQVVAGAAAAEAVLHDAEVQAARFRALYADSAATRVQVEAVETGLARARAGTNVAAAQRASVDALALYGSIRAPFGGVITERLVDPGALAAPGAPLVTIEDAHALRIGVRAALADVRGLARNQQLDAEIDGRPTRVRIEGVVPAAEGGVALVNALVDNGDGRLASGGAATLYLPTGQRHVLLVPAGSVTVQGDVSSVRVVAAAGPERRFVRTGGSHDGRTEILAGLQPGERVMLPAVEP